MIAKALPPALLACWLALAPAAQAAPAPGPADPVFPGLGSTAYDALDYHLAFDYREASRTVDGSATITARTRQPLRSLDLDALGLTVRQVTVDGRSAGFTLHDEKLTVQLPHRAPAGRALTLRVDYTADPRAALPHTGWVPTADGFAVAGQPNSAHTVFPCNDRPDDKARFTVSVTAPDALLGVAGGQPTATRERDGRTTREYRYREPMATELLQVAVGDYVLNEHQGPGGLPLRDVVPPARLAALKPALDLTAGQLEWIEQRLGPFPFEDYGLLPVDTDAPDAFGFTGLETQTLTLYKPGFLAQPEQAIAPLMMHELVHSWFGDSVTPRSWSDLWLNEGHADFYGLLYRYQQGWPDSAGLTTMDDRMRLVYSQADQWRHDWGPVADPTAANLWEEQRYLGGVLVLYALRQQVGESVFERIEHAFLARYRNGNASTADYVATASEVSGQDLSGFLGAWLHGTRTPPMPGHPDWRVDPVG
ncbi:M1 family metallopeptidase [Kitasatospora sp. NPDC006697]|uniref:M1 family metallopeptidase n=1 Tax=Kitasatospora sp. NPDC006697 TaxID=3364020 RepID=UPI0036B7A897